MSISRAIAQKIALSAINDGFKKEIKEDIQTESDLAIECYNAIFSLEIREAAKKAPKGWLKHDDCLRFNVGGYDIRLVHRSSLPVPSANYGCNRLGSIKGDLAEKVKNFIQERDKRKEKRDAAYKSIAESIVSARSYKKLAEAWPEGRPYFLDYLNAEKNRQSALTVPFRHINEVLGIAAE